MPIPARERRAVIRGRCAVLVVAALSIPVAGCATSPTEPSESVSTPTAHQQPDTLSQSPTALFEAVSASIVVVYGKDGEGMRRSLGSGVVIARGEVATNCHVIEHAATLSVTHRNRDYPATLKDADYERDVCSLTVTGFDAPVVERGETQSLKIGQKVFAIGAPYGLELTLSEGLISGLRDVPDGRVLQISAPISPGSSGGGLFGERGRLIGLPTFSLSGGQQVNFAVPVEWVTALSQRSTTTKPAAQRVVGWLMTTLVLERKKDWPGLLEHAQAWAQAQPQETMAWTYLGVACDQTKEFTKAIEAFQQALRIKPDFGKEREQRDRASYLDHRGTRTRGWSHFVTHDMTGESTSGRAGTTETGCASTGIAGLLSRIDSRPLCVCLCFHQGAV
ncbi:MAG: trypsin-like peptidase domain-containing protein [Nitrospirota bacterium]